MGEGCGEVFVNTGCLPRVLAVGSSDGWRCDVAIVATHARSTCETSTGSLSFVRPARNTPDAPSESLSSSLTTSRSFLPTRSPSANLSRPRSIAVLPLLRDNIKLPKLVPKSATRSERRARNWLQKYKAGGNALSRLGMSTPETKPTFLSAGITALSPWGSRSSTPKPPQDSHSDDGDKDKEKDKLPVTGMAPQRGGDHTVNRRHRLSLRKYPNDCPPLVVRWYHAVDVRIWSQRPGRSSLY
jgi:hypothetical protein